MCPGMVASVSRRDAALAAGALVIALFLVGIAPADPSQSPEGTNPKTDGYVGSEACSQCHSAIYQSFTGTPHAHASGPATANIVTGEFTHRKSGVSYRVFTDSGKVWMSFERAGDPLVRGKREFLYYIGQGRRGTTYIFSEDGFFFEAPINLYTSSHMWDMAPAYGNARESPMNLPVLTSCLDCHVSGGRPPTEGTENRYSSPLFLYAGVTCERCHGPGAAHVKSGGIVNPAKLAPERRDQVCMQCHLEGDAAIGGPASTFTSIGPVTTSPTTFGITSSLVAESRRCGLRANSKLWRRAHARRSQAMRCRVPVAMTRIALLHPKSGWRSIAGNAWHATALRSQRNTIRISPTAPTATCRQHRAAI